MTNRSVSKTIRTSSALLLAGILAAGLFAPSQKVKAAQVRRAVFAPIHVRAGERILLSVVNTDGPPVTARFFALNAADLSPLASSNPFPLPPGTGHFEPIQFSIDAFVAPAMEIVSPRDVASGQLKVSLQLLDSSGATRIFTECTGPFG